MNIISELYRMKSAGYSAEDAYRLVKDSIELDQFVELYEAAQ